MNFLEILGLIYLVELAWKILTIIWYTWVIVHRSGYEWKYIKLAFRQIPGEMKRMKELKREMKL